VARIRVSTVIDARPREVWAHIENVETHIRWMHDAETIRVTSPKSSGVGTRFECDTRIGPFRLTDHMEITAWDPPRCMAVDHEGLVKGRGRFVLKRARGGRTNFVWQEKLRFPVYLGGPVGAWFGKFVLKRVWRENLRTLRAQIEA
jgi:hypothetical protein